MLFSDKPLPTPISARQGYGRILERLMTDTDARPQISSRLEYTRHTREARRRPQPRHKNRCQATRLAGAASPGSSHNTESERAGPATRARERRAHGETAKTPEGPRRTDTWKHGRPAANPSHTNKKSQDTNTQPRGARTTRTQEARAVHKATSRARTDTHKRTNPHARSNQAAPERARPR